MEELLSLNYKEEVEALKDEPDYEALGDAKYINHPDMEARLYWAFCRPSGSSSAQIQDSHPLVSIMAFNHSRLDALQRFQLLHKDVIKNENLRIKITKRSRMLFRDLIDKDFYELNLVLQIVPVFLDLAVNQLIYGRKWNDIVANEIEATKFLNRIKEDNPSFLTDEFLDGLYEKLQNFEEFDAKEFQSFLERIELEKNLIDTIILEYYKEKGYEYLQDANLHILQKKRLEFLLLKL